MKVLFLLFQETSWQYVEDIHEDRKPRNLSLLFLSNGERALPINENPGMNASKDSEEKAKRTAPEQIIKDDIIEAILGPN